MINQGMKKQQDLKWYEWWKLAPQMDEEVESRLKATGADQTPIEKILGKQEKDYNDYGQSFRLKEKIFELILAHYAANYGRAMLLIDQVAVLEIIFKTFQLESLPDRIKEMG